MRPYIVLAIAHELTRPRHIADLFRHLQHVDFLLGAFQFGGHPPPSCEKNSAPLFGGIQRLRERLNCSCQQCILCIYEERLHSLMLTSMLYFLSM